LLGKSSDPKRTSDRKKPLHKFTSAQVCKDTTTHSNNKKLEDAASQKKFSFNVSDGPAQVHLWMGTCEADSRQFQSTAMQLPWAAHRQREARYPRYV
jgi:hypothetical protein